MESSSNDEIQSLKQENKILLGKIRGYQTLGQLFQDLKEKNRLLQLQCQLKETVSIGTETNPLDQISLKPVVAETKPATSLEPIGSLGFSKFTYPSTHDSCSQLVQSSSAENICNSEEINLKKNVEDLLATLKEIERKRANDKKVLKILNDELKKAKEEIQELKDQLQNSKHANSLLMKKISCLEQERDNISLSESSENPVVPGIFEGADDWIHLPHGSAIEESNENEYKIHILEEKCKELQEKALKWENDHFNLQMEYTKHGNDLRALLEAKSKELIQVSEKANSDKKILEGKFQVLEKMLKEEKESKFESYNLHQETMRKYKLLEKKFLTLEQKTNSSPKIPDVKEPCSHQPGLISDIVQQKKGLEQQIKLFKEDFAKEKKERIFAEKRAKEWEEKLRRVEKQLEKREREVSEYRSQKPKEISPKPYSGPKISKLPPCWSCEYCTFLNDPQVEECKMCRAKRPSRESPQVPGWKCALCSSVNSYKNIICNTCHSQKIQAALTYFDDDLTIDGPQPE